MQSTTPRVIVLLIVGASLAGCATVQVSQDYDPHAVHHPHRTWYWEESSQPPSGDLRVDNPLLNSRIRHAIQRHLTNRDIVQKQHQPDLSISYRLVIQSKLRSYSTYSMLGWGGYYYPWAWGGDVDPHIEQYDQCQLTIDIKAFETGALVWRGTGVYTFRTYDTPQAAAEAMQGTVDKILAQYPPHA